MRQTGAVLPSEQLHRPSDALQFVTLLALLAFQFTPSAPLHSASFVQSNADLSNFL